MFVISESSISGERFRTFFGLSRMSHSILDMAHPGIGALLVLGAFPDPPVLALGFLAAFSGFISVFALNDLMDWRIDTEKMAKYERALSSFDLDAMGFRHPIALGKLHFRAAFLWVVLWGLLSLGLAYTLRPLCAVILIAAVCLEIGYCRLLRVTHWKVLLSGSMVGIGALAGVCAITSSPPPGLVLLFFFWTFAWEIGGRNIPNDWSDLEEDVNLGIRTVPVRYGKIPSSRLSLFLISAVVIASLFFPMVTPMPSWITYEAGALAAGIFFLIFPALQWVSDQRTQSAMRLFNRACLYPLVIFAMIVLLMAC